MSNPDNNPVYGYSTGGDPRKFSPDPEMCSQAEMDNHRVACKRWNAAERRSETLPPEPCHCGYVRDASGYTIHVLSAHTALV